MSTKLPRSLRLLLAACVLALAFAAALLSVVWPPAQRYQNLIAVSWGDGTQGKALYGAYVYAQPDAAGVRVTATIYIGRPTLWQSYEHDPITLGVAPTDIDAVARWGQISWSEQGLTIGTGPHAVTIARSQLEHHR